MKIAPALLPVVCDFGGAHFDEVIPNRNLKIRQCRHLARRSVNRVLDDVAVAAFIERELVQDLLESATGARMHHSYCRVGGLKDDLPAGFLKESGECLVAIRKWIKQFEFTLGSETAQLRELGALIAS